MFKYYLMIAILILAHLLAKIITFEPYWQKVDDNINGKIKTFVDNENVIIGTYNFVTRILLDIVRCTLKCRTGTNRQKR